jgi:intraflagellar transport protein 74
MQRPGTAQRSSQRPGTASQRPGSASLGLNSGGIRQGTASTQQALSGASLTANVTIENRPITQHGMMGMRQATAGPGRQVQDVGFFIGMLRTKIGDIVVEIQRMRSELDRGAKDSVVTAQLERRYDAALKEVRSLEGDLADYNLALDKTRSSVVDSSEIVSVSQSVKRRNEALSRDLDSVFIERQERERGAMRLEEQIIELQRAAEARLNSLQPQQVLEYRQMIAETRALSQEANGLQAELEQVNTQVEEAEAELKRDKVRDEYSLLEKRSAHFWKERSALEEELAATRLDPGAARDKLMSKVKEETARIQAIEKQIKATEDAKIQKKQFIADATSEIDDRRGEAGDNAKYEMLFKRDQEMTEFIDRFPEVKDKEVIEQRRIQNTIVALLEHVAEGVERERSMPSRDAAEEMKDDLGDKKKELKASEMTADRLRDELSLRQTELEKINTLDVKIGAELKALSERMASMKSDLSMFADIPGLRAACDQTRSILKKRLLDYIERREAQRPLVLAAAAEYEKKKAVLAKEPQNAAIEALEKKLKTYEQTVFTLREFIASKGRETDFEPIRDECLKLLSELNLLVQRDVGGFK